jgi:peptidyl-prolyl cis-trans isomerase B (cyclophilin B)
MFHAKITYNRCLFILLALSALSFTSCMRSQARDELKRVDCLTEIIQRVDQARIGEDHFFETKLLAGEFPEMRRWSALALGQIGSPRALPLLYRAIHTGDMEIRALSAFSVGEIEKREHLVKIGMALDSQAIPEITKLLDDSASIVRIRAIEALGKMGSETEALEIIRRAERFDCSAPADSDAIRYSITALGRLHSTKSFGLLLKWARLNEWPADNSIESNAGRVLDTISQITLPLWQQHQEQSSSAATHSAHPEQEKTQAPSAIVLTGTAARTIAFNRSVGTVARVATNRGAFEIELFRDDAPITSENFATAAENGVFNKAVFVQDSGITIVSGLPGPRSALTFTPAHEINTRSFVRGSVGITHEEGKPSRLFITLDPQPYLDGVHVCFGRVISGIQIVEKLSPGDRLDRIEIMKKTPLLEKIKY